MKAITGFFKGLYSSVIGGNWKSKAYGACGAVAVMHLIDGRPIWAAIVFGGGLALAVWEYLEQK